MRNTKGFSLISFLLYLMLFSLITFFLCHSIVSLVIPSLKSVRQCQSIMALHIASDLFVRDIRAGIDHWQLFAPYELVWHINGNDIGWSFSDGYLKRTTGLYERGWKAKVTSVVATGVLGVRFTPEKAQDRIVGLEMEIEPKAAQGKLIKCYVATGNSGRAE